MRSIVLLMSAAVEVYTVASLEEEYMNINKQISGNCIPNFHWGGGGGGGGVKLPDIQIYRVRNHVLHLHVRYIRQYTAQTKYFEYELPHSDAIVTVFLQNNQVKMNYVAQACMSIHWSPTS